MNSPRDDRQQRENILGDRDIDRNYDWYHSLSKYPNIRYNLNFVQELPVTVPEGCVLNEDQQQIVDFVVNCVKTGRKERSIIVMGAAGTGKTCVVIHLLKILGDDNVLLMAPTGIAANLINGKTIHTALRITTSNRPLTGDVKLEFQEEMKGIKAIIIDEFSMIGLTLLGKMDQRLRQADPSKEDQIFGGFLLVLFGDYNQLPPVCDSPMYAEPHNAVASRGKIAYGAFNKVFTLTKIIRQAGPEQAPFRDTLGRLANGFVTTEDYNYLATRFLSANKNLINEFENAVRFMVKNSDVDQFNLRMLAQRGKPVTVCNAEHNNRTAECAKRDEANCLDSQLPLCIGARVLLRRDLCPSYGLSHGSLGTVSDIIYDVPSTVRHRKIPSELPLCILVHFDDYHGPTLYNNVVPIIPYTVSFSKNAVTCTRKQFPVELAYALSIHRAQGLTVTKAIVDIGPREFSLGITYVGSSRVTAFDGLLYSPDFSKKRLFKVNEHKAFEAKRAEIRRLKALPP